MDWATAAGIIVAAAAIIGLIIQFFKKDKPWRDSVEKHNLRISSIEIEIKHISEGLEQLRNNISDHDERDQRDFERLENKIEKLTDLMIQLIQDEKRQNSYNKITYQKAIKKTK